MDTVSFAAPVLRLPNGMRMHYLPIPQNIADVWVRDGVRRILGTLNGHPIDRGLQGLGDGARAIMLGRSLLREIGAAYGETVVAELRPDPNPDGVEVPEELAVALAQDDEARRRFEGMTPGKRRSLCHYVSGAKRTETRIKRSLELAHKLRTYTLYGDLNP